MNERGDTPETRFAISLADDDATKLSVTGGKGATLARLIAADFPVPSGFCATTAVYHTLTDTPEIRAAIESLEALAPEETEAIADGSSEVRSKIQSRTLPDTVRHAVTEELDTPDGDTYAVRSSATAEDLPTASFAGQHETFLGVSDGEPVFDRLRDCLASLFTERAVAYRLRNDIAHSEVAMAVVIQEMVDPAVAGVLFTADPVTGNRHVASVDANYGLGETVVSGEVSPDNARIDRRTREILAYEVGEKRYALRSDAGGNGTEPVALDSEKQATRVLSDAQLRRLVALGGQVEDLLGTPQDIEWALVEGDFVLLQSRPITSLFPLPEPAPDDDRLHVYFSIGHQQAMAEALPPLVVDWWRELLNNTAARVRSGNTEAPWAVEAGHRVYIDITPLLRFGPLKRGIPVGIAAANEPAAAALQGLLTGRSEAFPAHGRVTTIRSVGRVLRRGAPKLVPHLLRASGRFIRVFVSGPPEPRREQARIEAWGEELASRIREPETVAERVRAAFQRSDLLTVLSRLLPRIGPLLVASLLAQKTLERLFPDADTDLDASSKGLENELVTRMNQRLGDLADLAREHSEVREALRKEASLADISEGEGGQAFGNALSEFLDEFGHRASGEIDLSRPRWNDNPATLIRTIRSNLAGTDPGTHRAHLQHLERNAAAAATRLEARADHGVLGPVRKAVVRRLIRAYRGGIQFREYPKQGVAHLFTAVHEVISDAGAALAADGRLDGPEDVWYLRKEELFAALAEDAPIDADIDARRRAYERDRKKTAPPILTSEGEAPAATMEPERTEGVLSGTPVSSGVVEGPARVIRDPSSESLEKGEILVAPTTDPGWTPLFLNAAGLVMEVGGRMTHGALVAREYGIPAVASVSNATEEIRTGERIRLDGKRGTVELLDRSERY
ncbi:phosphoenolpyruvate protein kinase [Haloferax mediterranei ATCC 33500]|uniref:Phosphoenolpyruvate protein kinase n=1 Tax=Haloferax mediterranei (strain ATCC 33500 / DSM 1411 / JCM 8866 / NBRC 14739 / NCIMB 2177 / R-4) TaxID=523841 RepID=I3R7Z4_HALMT|nr:PEP/pyruvate-binding domain-containing protein [Haloferax mediterranei]AFK20354.1 phosphoenolpyruvate synthase / pyruvate, water dikinase [Haloferax mediterranei ATCC 33500]AHZ23722.1 phosphoenolpyruvate protein kinase [Haloferax mediterranei ATCC 33500]ELZ99210.1 phosphoenolpyruvate synthase / pyruvate, water dikinase [Haloferax mediterranei ATCC 33500]MDX5986890.1 PEP/pyruvate-binding domain-containing protein [Haloferax mediterranei ATCC 33500]QCQ76212.1 phosphoenolpyruvate protein kinas